MEKYTFKQLFRNGHSLFPDLNYEQYSQKEFVAVTDLIKEIQHGCGEEFLTEDGDFELMCGKHIWKALGEVSEYRLCEDCIDKLDALRGNDDGD